ncbi:MAG: transposase [Candidatus Thiothrix singaporensis]|uniref:Transposase n=1 Tax=Candidatus Thiothrix singaporensis TaxID=2799669 RepID=A0A7L6ASX2_9GAMM|nr:MAG: transposase [Candidatus Thiothrix singaporensis]
MDASESPIERPKKQGDFYSGKKHTHTQKFQLVIDQASGHILHVAQAVSNEHDVTLARQHTEAFPPGCLCLGDLGYQGLEIEGCRILIPFKSPGCGSWNRNKLLSTRCSHGFGSRSNTASGC